MSKAKYPWKKYVKPLASLKLAVIVITGIGAITGYGTIVESQYDARTALDTVYHSFFAYSIYALLTVNLTAVIADRYPWKRNHIGFISAHIGIIILILGSILTRYYGIDGSLPIDIGQSGRHVLLSDTELSVYSSMDGGRYTNLYHKDVNFSLYPPQDSPWKISLPSSDIEIKEYWPYALVNQRIVPSGKVTDPPAFRFQMSNDRVSESQWVQGNGRKPAVLNFGPAKLVFTEDGKYPYVGGNIIHLYPTKAKDRLNYEIFTASRPDKLNRGKIKAGGFVDTGWMGLTFRLLSFYPAARMQFDFEKLSRPKKDSGGATISVGALRIGYDGKEHWLAMNSSLKLFSNTEMYLIAFGNKRVDLGFQLHLNEFKATYYPGTRSPKEYESHIITPEKDKVVISMNEPLNYKGFKFFQSSFQSDEMGRPKASILSVNFDPGRWWKYLGSILIVFGIIHLFYFSSGRGRANAKK